jgi:hypothetical protein
MAAKRTILTHKIAIQLHLMTESCTICSSRSRRPVRTLLDTPSYKQQVSKLTVPLLAYQQHVTLPTTVIQLTILPSMNV